MPIQCDAFALFDTARTMPQPSEPSTALYFFFFRTHIIYTHRVLIYRIYIVKPSTDCLCRVLKKLLRLYFFVIHPDRLSNTNTRTGRHTEITLCNKKKIQCASNFQNTIIIYRYKHTSTYWTWREPEAEEERGGGGGGEWVHLVNQNG